MRHLTHELHKVNLRESADRCCKYTVIKSAVNRWGILMVSTGCGSTLLRSYVSCKSLYDKI